MGSRVSVVKCNDYDTAGVFKAVKESVDLIGGIKNFVSPGQRVLLKPNLLSARPPEDSVTTHPVILESVIRLVQESGGHPIIGDSPPLGNWDKIVRKSGIQEVADRHNIEVVPFLISKKIQSREERVFKSLEISEEVQKADVIINLPKLKTHSLTRLTLGVKNIFGCVVGKRKAQWHLNAGSDDIYFARMLIDLYTEVSPALTILDGIVAMEGKGPSGGDPKHIGLVLSAPDSIALDTVVCNILGKSWDYMFTNRVAREMGVGETDIEKIKILGQTVESVRVKEFQFPTTYEPGRIGRFLKKNLQSLFTSKPIEDRAECTLCGFCIESCPPAVITKENKRLKFDYTNCIRCFCCQEVCPEKAMKIKDGPLIKWIS